MTLEELKREFNILSPEIVVQKNLIEGNSYFFRELEV